MGDKMIKRYSRLIFPYKKTNLLVIFTLFLGLILGSVFANIIGLNDRNLVTDKIKLFISNVGNNSINSLVAFKNSLGINLIYIIFISLLALALLGIIFNLLLLFTKSFILGFSISSFILTYKFKGIILSLLYLLCGQIFSLIIVACLTIYSMMLAKKLLMVIWGNNNGIVIRKTLKNYFILVLLAIVISIVASLMEAFLLPALVKLIIKLFI